MNRHGEGERFKPFKELHNRRLLWHGSRTTNYVGILSQGLRIAPPEAPVVSPWKSHPMTPLRSCHKQQEGDLVSKENVCCVGGKVKH